MGSCVSNNARGKKKAVDPRPILSFPNLRMFDIILIQSRVLVGGVNVDREIGKFVTFKVGDIYVERSNVLQCKYDRVGIIQVPGFLEPKEYDLDNIEVTEATENGVVTNSLREICEGAMSVSIRHLKIGEEYAQHVAEEKQKEELVKKKKKKRPAGHGFMNYDDPVGEEDVEHAAKKKNSPGVEKSERRIAMEETFYGMAARLMNKRYTHAVVVKSHYLDEMFKFFVSKLGEVELQPDELAEVRRIVSKYDGEEKGIELNSLAEIFVELGRSELVKSTFSNSEIIDVTGKYSLEDDLKRGISTEEFMQDYIQSYKRNMISLKTPHQVLSGAFVSTVLQELDLLPSNDPTQFYLPAEFAQTHRNHTLPHSIETALIDCSLVKEYQVPMQEKQTTA